MSITKLELSESVMGMVLARPVKTGARSVLVQAGVELSERLLEMLLSRGVTHVYVYGESEESAVMTDDPEKLARIHEREQRRFGDVSGSPLQEALLDAVVATKLEDPFPQDTPVPAPQLGPHDVPDRRAQQEMVRGAQRLPTLSCVYREIARVTADRNASAADVARVASSDPAFASSLLKVANSALYSQTEPVATVTRAVSMLGLKSVRDICLATSVMEAVGSLDIEIRPLSAFWNHALGAGAASRVIAEECGIRQPEEHFLAGLMHDLGELLWLDGYPRAIAAVYAAAAREGATVHECERNLLGLSHTRLGKLVGRHWHLPPQYLEAIEKHHEPETAEQWPEMTATVHLADILAAALELSGPSLRRVPRIADEAWALLGFDLEDLPHLLATIRSEFRHTQQAFPLRAGEAIMS